MSMPSAQTGFFSDHSRGWHWYEEQEKEEIGPKSPSRKLERKKPLTPSQQLARFQTRLKESLHRALMLPTRTNLASYMRLQQIMMERAELFGKKWMEVVFTHPHLDYTATHPVNQVGRFAYEEHTKKTTEKTIRSLAKTYGLFFFFKEECPYCHAFAPIVKGFSEKYGWKVVAISMDGSRLKEFPEAVSDNGAATGLGVNVFPTLLAVNPKTEAVIPLSYGLSSHDQIEERIHVLIKKEAL